MGWREGQVSGNGIQSWAGVGPRQERENRNGQGCGN